MKKLSLSENLNDLLNVISVEDLTEVQGGWGWKPKKPKKPTKPTDPIYIMIQPPTDPGPMKIMAQPKP